MMEMLKKRGGKKERQKKKQHETHRRTGRHAPPRARAHTHSHTHTHTHTHTHMLTCTLHPSLASHASSQPSPASSARICERLWQWCSSTARLWTRVRGDDQPPGLPGQSACPLPARRSWPPVGCVC